MLKYEDTVSIMETIWSEFVSNVDLDTTKDGQNPRVLESVD